MLDKLYSFKSGGDKTNLNIGNSVLSRNQNQPLHWHQYYTLEYEPHPNSSTIATTATGRVWSKFIRLGKLYKQP